jgi:hypothetical protein
VGIAIMRAGAQAVIKGFEGSPHAALTAANRYQGLQGRRGPPVGQGGPLPQGVLWGARWGARAYLVPSCNRDIELLCTIPPL